MSGETGSAGDESVVGPGELARDVSEGRAGVVLMRTDSFVQLRPLGGGRQWDAKPESVRRMTPREELSVRLAWVNAGHRWGR
ncbi:hypothetical protein ABZW18_02890 [Streptomyces sp. NPDC004647]|uniref:hypothetical protein n=1 Tax=Streptomyces sp. NPDC004647 TaxID=3154671 RepID=UPI0033B99AB4